MECKCDGCRWMLEPKFRGKGRESTESPSKPGQTSYMSCYVYRNLLWQLSRWPNLSSITLALSGVP